MDQETDWKKYLKIYLRTVRTTVMYFVFAVTSTFSHWMFFGMADFSATGDYVGNVALALIAVGIQLLLLSSLVRNFTENDYNRLEYRDVLAIKSLTRKRRIVRIVKDKRFLTDAAAVLFWMLVLPIKFGFSQEITLLNGAYSKWWLMPLMYAVFLYTYIATHLSVLKRYQKKRPGESRRALVPSVVGTVVVYSIGSLAVPFTFTVIGVFYRLTKGILVYILLALLAVFLALFVLKYVRAYLKRRSFMARLVHVCDDNGWILSSMENMYSSLLFDRDGYNFEVRRDGQRYSCKMLCGIYKRSRMFLCDDGLGRRVHVLRYKKLEMPYFTSYFTYDFESENTKVLIINPIPSLVFWDHGGKTSPIDVGYRIGEYKVYNASGFLGAVERNCLDHRGDE